ncbi:MAG: hypothetical protein L3K25_17455 [Gammaproteobacteria bacterium]|nr:hypothetical protein [Gammaproteobacteria bacterium]
MGGLTVNSDISLTYSQQDLARLSWGRHRRLRFYPLDPFAYDFNNTRNNHYPVIRSAQDTASPGMEYHFVPATILLLSDPNPADVTFFGLEEWPQAREFLDSLTLSDEQLAMMIEELKLRAWPNRADRLKSLLMALTRGNVVIVRIYDDITPPRRRGPEDLPVEEYTPKPYTLGPHDEPGYVPNPHAGLHNQEELTPDHKTSAESFKPIREVDMDDLSEVDEITKEALTNQGWDDDKVKQVLKSGDGFTETPFKSGDKIYGFNTAGRARKLDTSAYLLDETGMADVKDKYFKQGHWDKEGVKNYLALPCFNGASQIDAMEVTMPTTGIQATIGKATELLRYDGADGYTTGTIGKIMGGGGKQITLDTSALKLLPKE